MKKNKKHKNKLSIKDDELFPLYNLTKINKNKKNNNKCICYSLICLINLFIIIIFLQFFIIVKLINSVLKPNKNSSQNFTQIDLKYSKINEKTTTDLNNLMMHYNSNTTILLVGIEKFENNYIREWVEYHKGIGINKIILCDNNPIDGEKLSEPIKDYVDSNFVEKDESFRGKSLL